MAFRDTFSATQGHAIVPLDAVHPRGGAVIGLRRRKSATSGLSRPNTDPELPESTPSLVPNLVPNSANMTSFESI